MTRPSDHPSASSGKALTLPLEPTLEMGAAGLAALEIFQRVGAAGFSFETEALDYADFRHGDPRRWVMPIYRAMVAVAPRAGAIDAGGVR